MKKSFKKRFDNLFQCLICFLLFNYSTQRAFNFKRRPYVSPHPQIVGARSAESIFPFFASLIEIVGQQVGAYPFCGATIIDQSFCVTAAHCFDNYQNYLLYTPILNLEDPTQDQVHFPERQILFPNYNNQSYKHDIALIQLSEPLSLGHRLQTIKLTEFPPRNCAMKVVVGFGIVNEKLEQPNNLQVAEVFDDTEFCEEYINYPQFEKGFHFCSLCNNPKLSYTGQGDSGGPYLTYDKGHPVLLGIISLTVRQDEDCIVIFTRVDAYMNWIQTSLDEFYYT